MKNLKSIILFCLMLLLALTGCTNSVSKQGETSEADTSVTLGLNLWPGTFPWYIAKEKGFFEKNGVDVEIISFPVVSDLLSAQSSQQIDASGGMTMSDLLVPLSNGIPLKTFMVNDTSNGADALIAKDNVSSIADLKGKKIATEVGTVNHLLLLVGLEKHGLEESDISFTNMMVNDAGPAFINGQIDAALLYEPFVSEALEHKNLKAKVIYSSADTPGLIADVFVTSEKLGADRETVKKLILSWFDAVAYLESNPDESFDIMAKATETPVDALKQAFEGIKIYTLEDNLAALKEDNNYSSLYFTAETTGAFLKEVGYIKEIPDYKTAIDFGIIQEILEESK